MPATGRKNYLLAICDLVSERTGLWSGPDMQQRMERLLPRRMAAGCYRQTSEYYHFLRDNPFGREEISRLASLLTGRRPRLMHPDVCALVAQFVSSRAAQGVEGPAVLAVGTTAAEDIYTAAITLGRAGIDVASSTVTMAAADIDLDRLLRGADGVYTKRALSALQQHELEEYFECPPGRRPRVKRVLRDCIRWLYANPLNGWAGVRSDGRYDLIICRELFNHLKFSVLDTWSEPGPLLSAGGALICDRRMDLDGAFDLSQYGKYWTHRKSPELPSGATLGRRAAHNDSEAGFAEAMSAADHLDVGEAERHLTSAIRGEPFSAPHRVAMAMLLLRKDEPAHARAEALAALSLEPHSPEALLACGTTHQELGDLKTAERFYRKALLVCPEMPAASRQLGKLHNKAGREADAIPALA